MDSIETYVINKFNSLNIGKYEDLRPYMKKQIIEIEEYIADSSTKRQNAISLYRENNVTIKSISDNTSVSKATIYNNPDILKKYIDERIKECESVESKFYDKDKINKLENNYSNLQELYDNIMVQVIDMNNLKIENENLRKELELKKKIIADFSMTNNLLMKELQDVKRDFLKASNNVINFK
jgi:hypothetical protein